MTIQSKPEEPKQWEGHYKLNTCIECGHYLFTHETRDVNGTTIQIACRYKGCECKKAIGRYHEKENKDGR
jgi:hypothetical protein